MFHKRNKIADARAYSPAISYAELKRLLTEEGIDPNSNDRGLNALHVVGHRVKHEVLLSITLLLEYRTNINSIERITSYQCTPLHFLLANECDDVVIYTLQEADLLNITVNFDAADSEKKTILIFAAKMRKEETALFILNKAGGKIHLDAQDGNGMTALHYACALGQARLAAELLQKGASPYIEDNHNRKPIECLDLDKDELTLLLKSVSIAPTRDEFALRNCIVDHNGQPLLILNTENRDADLLDEEGSCSIKTNRAYIEQVLQGRIFNSDFTYKYGARVLLDHFDEVDANPATDQIKVGIVQQFDKMSGISMLDAIIRDRKLVNTDILQQTNRPGCR